MKGLVFDAWWSQLTDEDIYGGAGNWLALGVAELANKLLAFAERDISAEAGEGNRRAVEEECVRGLVGQGFDSRRFVDILRATPYAAGPLS